MKNMTTSIILLLISFNLYAAEIYEIDINEIDVTNVGQSIQRFDRLCTENTDCSERLDQYAFASIQVDYEQIKMLTTHYLYRPIIVDGGLFLVHENDLSISNGFLYFNVLGLTAPHELVGFAKTNFLVQVATHSNVKNLNIVRLQPAVNEIQAVFGGNNNDVIVHDGIDGTPLGTIPGTWQTVDLFMIDIYGETGAGSNKRTGYYVDGMYVEGTMGSLNALLNSGAVIRIIVKP